MKKLAIIGGILLFVVGVVVSRPSVREFFHRINLPKVEAEFYGLTPWDFKEEMTGCRVVSLMVCDLQYSKLTTHYRFVMSSNEGYLLDEERYLQEFPEDFIHKSSSGHLTLFAQVRPVFDPSDYTKPDEVSAGEWAKELQRIEAACKARAKWLRE